MSEPKEEQKAPPSKRMLTTIGVAIAAVGIIALLSPRTDTPDFQEYEAGKERKQAFFSYFLPIIQERNQEIATLREEVLALQQKADDLSRSEKRKLKRVAESYKIKEFDAGNAQHWQLLLKRLDVVPPSLALAQAANESAWGTSRFARTANNYFGQWCFEPGCGVVPNQRDQGKSHEVAKFSSPQKSVESYFNNLNTHNAYQPLRSLRAQLRANDQPITGVQLAHGLERYSERGEEYIAEIQSMIRYNKLEEHD